MGALAIEVEAVMAAGGDRVEAITHIGRDVVDGVVELPMSFAQQRMWVLDQIDAQAGLGVVAELYRWTPPRGVL